MVVTCQQIKRLSYYTYSGSKLVGTINFLFNSFGASISIIEITIWNVNVSGIVLLKISYVTFICMLPYKWDLLHICAGPTHIRICSVYMCSYSKKCPHS